MGNMNDVHEVVVFLNGDVRRRVIGVDLDPDARSTRLTAAPVIIITDARITADVLAVLLERARPFIDPGYSEEKDDLPF